MCAIHSTHGNNNRIFSSVKGRMTNRTREPFPFFVTRIHGKYVSLICLCCLNEANYKGASFFYFVFFFVSFFCLNELVTEGRRKRL